MVSSHYPTVFRCTPQGVANETVVPCFLTSYTIRFTYFSTQRKLKGLPKLEPATKRRRRVKVEEEEKTSFDDAFKESLKWCTVGVREFDVGYALFLFLLFFLAVSAKMSLADSTKTQWKTFGNDFARVLHLRNAQWRENVKG